MSRLYSLREYLNLQSNVSSEFPYPGGVRRRTRVRPEVPHEPSEEAILEPLPPMEINNEQANIESGDINEGEHDDTFSVLEEVIQDASTENTVSPTDDGDLNDSDLQDLIAAAIQDTSEGFSEPYVEEAASPCLPSLIPDDGAEEIPHTRASSIQEMFATLLGLWCEYAGISRSHYAALVQILKTLKDIRPIQHLPQTLDTLKHQFRTQFPLLPIRKKKIPVVSTKLPTLSAAAKNLANSATSWMYFQDPIALLENTIRSPKFRSRMHRGMAHFVDEPAELWESFSWASSIRSTSGEFARYFDGSPIFVSDVVKFRCTEPSCSCLVNAERHIGRIQAVGKDFSSRSVSPGVVTLTVHPYIRSLEASRELRKLLTQKNQPSFAENELLVHESPIKLLESNIIERITDIYFDYKFGNKLVGQIGQPAEKTFVRRAVNEALSTVSPICKTSPTRGELEVKTYGRKHLMETFEANKCLSVPYQLFIDGFGLYRNMYCSVMGIYMIPACLSAVDRAKETNVYPITLGPHGSNFHDVIATLKRLSVLESGINTTQHNLRSEEPRLVAFCSAYLGDMPQQQDNSGFKRPTARRSCRNCFIQDTNRDDLDYDTRRMGRYHHHTLSTRDCIERKPRSERDELLKEYGLALQQTPLLSIAPSLNLDTFFPSDPCHSEYAGISKLAHSLLVNTILSKKGQDEYAWQLQRFRFPFGWGRLQSPIHHLESYQLQEHARASVILPLLLRCCLRKTWIMSTFWSALSKTYQSPIDAIVQVFANIAKSNSVLVSQKISAEDRINLLDIIQRARLGLQTLLEIAATASKNPESFRAIKYRPNMHIGIHYPKQANEYAVPNNCNILAGENKHRLYKRLVQRTNKRDVEKFLLQQESFRRTLLLLIEGAFAENEPDLSARILDMYYRCPLIFKHYLQLSDPEPDDHDDETEPEELISLNSFRNIRPWSFMTSREVQQRFQIPLRLSKLPTEHSFLKLLRDAYEIDYDRQHILNLGTNPTKWCRKVSFVISGKVSTTLSPGDYICYRGGSMGRVNGIFIHYLPQNPKRIFLHITPIRTESRVIDGVLGLPMYEINNKCDEIIGLPSITGVKLYMIGVSMVDREGGGKDIRLGGEKLIHCTWDMEFF